MSAEHRREHGVVSLRALGDPVGVFLDCLQALLLAVAVRDLIAQAGADAEGLGALGDGVQRAGDLAVGGVVVEDGGHALLDAVEVQRVGAGLRAIHIEVTVDGPPGPVQHLVKVRGVVALDGKAAGEGGVDVRVRIDKGWHDHTALCVDDLGVGVLRAQGAFLADGGDLCALIGDGTVLVVAAPGFVAGDESSVGHKLHGKYLLIRRDPDVRVKQKVPRVSLRPETLRIAQE